MHQPDCHVELALHAARVGADDAVGGLGQTEPLEQFRGSLPERGSRHAVGLSLEDQVLAAGGVDVETRVLGDHSDETPHLAWFPEGVVAGDPGFAGVRTGEGGEDLHLWSTFRRRSGRAVQTPCPRRRTG